MAIERPTNAIESVADVQETDLLREVSDNEEKVLPDVPDGLREPRDEPQELQSLPVEGESRDSKWQAAEANGMAADVTGRAEAIEKAADVNRKALPGGELVNRASRVNGMPDGRQPQAQQGKLHHKRSQRNENAKRNIPSAHRVPLEGEWSVCASGRVRDLNLDSCGRGVGERASVDKWSWPVEMPRPTMWIPGYCQLGRVDGNASCKETSADGQDESAKLVPMTVELDDPGGSETPHVCLGGTKTQVGKVESHRSRVDKLNGQANESRGQAKASTVLNTCETVVAWRHLNLTLGLAPRYGLSR